MDQDNYQKSNLFVNMGNHRFQPLFQMLISSPIYQHLKIQEV